MEEKAINGVTMLPPKEERDEGSHLSPTKMAMLKRCEVQFAYRYLQGLKLPPSVALITGSAYDDSLTTNYRQKITSEVDLPVSDVVDAFCTSFDVRKEEAEVMEWDDIDAIRDIGVGLVRLYQKTISPNIHPAETQKEYAVHFPGVDWYLKGFSDVIEKDGTIRDNKTKGKTPSKSIEPDHHFQMMCYSIAEKMEHGPEAGNKLFLDYAIKTKVPKIIQVEVPAPTDNDMRYFQHITSTVQQRIEQLKSGELAPITGRNQILCSRKFCGYWSLCERDHGGTVKE